MFTKLRLLTKLDPKAQINVNENNSIIFKFKLIKDFNMNNRNIAYDVHYIVFRFFALQLHYHYY